MFVCVSGENGVKGEKDGAFHLDSTQLELVEEDVFPVNRRQRWLLGVNVGV